MKTKITNEPLAFLLTFTCYGTWLHGTSRGSVDKNHNQFGEELVPKDVEKERDDFIRMKHAPIILTTNQRSVVVDAIQEVCQHRNWRLEAVNVRTNHVHIVVLASADPKKMIGDFKSYATRKLRENCLIEENGKTWTRGGSCRYLWDENSINAASRYVKEQ